jgi:hypothetical protein
VTEGLESTKSVAFSDSSDIAYIIPHPQAQEQEIDHDFGLDIPRVDDPSEDREPANTSMPVSLAPATLSSSLSRKALSRPSSRTLTAKTSSSSSHSFYALSSFMLNQLDPETRKEYAISKIQRQARKKNALRAAQAEQQWKMFADLDTQDEAEMLQLAVFMQTLLDVVPKTKSAVMSPTQSLSMDDDNRGDSSTSPSLSLSPDDGTSISRSISRSLSQSGDTLGGLVDEFESCIRLENIHFAPMGTKHRAQQDSEVAEHLEVDLSAKDIDLDFVSELVALFRRGGRVTKSTVMKILRRVYKMLLKLPNTTRLTVTDKCKLTVIGDLHGQLPDLLYILDECGLPNANNKFVFNGDFVDRGDKGCEIVCILFSMMVACGPEVVALNRGNHEDLPVCRVYGFEAEVKEKYDELLFEMFAEVSCNVLFLMQLCDFSHWCFLRATAGLQSLAIVRADRRFGVHCPWRSLP